MCTTECVRVCVCTTECVRVCGVPLSVYVCMCVCVCVVGEGGQGRRQREERGARCIAWGHVLLGGCQLRSQTHPARGYHSVSVALNVWACEERAGKVFSVILSL